MHEYDGNFNEQVLDSLGKKYKKALAIMCKIYLYTKPKHEGGFCLWVFENPLFKKINEHCYGISIVIEALRVRVPELQKFGDAAYVSKRDGYNARRAKFVMAVRKWCKS